MKTLGIIGGLGPAATALLFTRIVDFTLVSTDQDHIDITVLNRPWIPDRTAWLLGREGASPFAEPMRETAEQLEALGCDVLAVPCNTAHATFTDFTYTLEDARCLHMLDEAAAFAHDLDCSCVGVLATDGTLETGVYADALSHVGLEALYPTEDDQREVMSLIYDDVKANIAPDPARLESLCEHLVARGADGIVLGCTELSVVPHERRVAGAPVIDALEVLAWSCVRECEAPAFDLPGAYATPPQGRGRPRPSSSARRRSSA